MGHKEVTSKPNRNRKAINSILTVNQIKQLSPHFIRVVFNSELVLEIDTSWILPHLKLIFPHASQTKIEFPQFNEDNKVIWQEGMRERVRTYSVRSYDAVNQLLTIDFAIHQDGVATLWSQQAKIGDQIGLLAMGSKNQFNAEQTLILLGDIAALPAISYSLEHLPSNHQALALIELPSEQDKPNLILPEQVKVEWVITSPKQPSQLLARLASINFDESSQKLIFLGGMESSIAQSVRHYLKQHFSEQASVIHIVSYWRQGLAEGQFKHSD